LRGSTGRVYLILRCYLTVLGLCLTVYCYMSDPVIHNDPLRKQAWDYFQMHASQRLTTFNFYIVISSVITTGLFSTFQKDYKATYLGTMLGLLLCFFSFIFWKVDIRNKQLIKGAEEALKFFESTTVLQDKDGEPHIAKIFQHEEYATKRRRERKSILLWKNYYSYSNSFNKVFLAFAIIGLIGALLSAIKIF
jgi:hypothetical protein